VATISALRETLRGQLGDVSRLAVEKRYENAFLNEALFEGLRQHNKSLTWSTVPVEEEQLILLLAKSRIARDKALEYSLDTRVSVSSNFSSDKTGNASMLLQVANDLQDEYERQRDRLCAQDSVSGDIVIGNLIRDSRLIHAKVPVQIAPSPPKPRLLGVSYLYYPNAQVNVPSGAGGFQILKTPTGRLVLSWARVESGDLAYLRFYASQNPRAPLETWTVVRTIYDYYSDTLAFERVSGPWISTGEAQMAKQELWTEYTLLPTGTWHFRLAAVNWNMLAAMSDVVSIRIENAIDLTADIAILEV
jgi:hypothetical protein